MARIWECGSGSPCSTAGPPLLTDSHDELRWLTADQLDDVGWLSADLAVVDRLRSR
jgi:hypothetical protein